MNKSYMILSLVTCLFGLTACDKLKSFPKPKTTDVSLTTPNQNESRTYNAVTYGKNSPIIDSSSEVKGNYITHGENSPIVLKNNGSVNITYNSDKMTIKSQ